MRKANTGGCTCAAETFPSDAVPMRYLKTRTDLSTSSATAISDSDRRLGGYSNLVAVMLIIPGTYDHDRWNIVNTLGTYWRDFNSIPGKFVKGASTVPIHPPALHRTSTFLMFRVATRNYYFSPRFCWQIHYSRKIYSHGHDIMPAKINKCKCDDYCRGGAPLIQMQFSRIALCPLCKYEIWNGSI